MNISPLDKKERIYQIWRLMIGRCHNENWKNYYTSTYYRDRGISVCDEWRQDFYEFKRWALCNGYNDSLSIDRIDPDGNYCPTNCRWIPLAENRKLHRQTSICNSPRFKGHPTGKFMVVRYSPTEPYWSCVGTIVKTGLSKPDACRFARAERAKYRYHEFGFSVYVANGKREGCSVVLNRLHMFLNKRI